MLDRAWSFALRNLATLFLIYALVACPLHIAHSYAFRAVLAVRELHSDIRQFPEFREVRGVGRADLRNARLSLLALTLLELGLLPLAYGATRRVYEVDAEGGDPEVLDSWRYARSNAGDFVASVRSAPGPMLLASVVGLLIGWLTLRIGEILIDPLGPDQTFAGVALTAASARSLGLVFVLSALVFAGLGAHNPAKRSSSGKSVDTRDSTSV
ncbi:MAG: hypothetical protein ABR505_01810 [Actinomycetota bacterium]